MASGIRRWLQKQPHPHTLRAIDANGDERAIRLGVGRLKWTEAEKLIGSAVTVEALDEEGATLRVFGEEEKPTKGGNKELVELARIISAAHDAGAARCEGAYQLGFSQLVAVTTAMSERLAMLEKVYTELIMAQASDGAEDPSGMEGLVGQIIAAKFGVMPRRKMGIPPAPEKQANGSSG